MTAFSGYSLQTHGTSTQAKIKALRQAMQGNNRKLEEVRQQRQSAEEGLAHCSKDLEQSLDLIRKNGKVVELLQDLDGLMQEESCLSDQLKGETTTSRGHHEHVQKMTECMVTKARSLTLEILEVKQLLAEAKARYKTAQDMKQAPASKSQRKQRVAKT